MKSTGFGVEKQCLAQHNEKPGFSYRPCTGYRYISSISSRPIENSLLSSLRLSIIIQIPFSSHTTFSKLTLHWFECSRRLSTNDLIRNVLMPKHVNAKYTTGHIKTEKTGGISLYCLLPISTLTQE